jgi:hypothetical protein
MIFYLKKNRIKKNGEAPIYLRVTSNGQQNAISIHRSIDVNLWNTDANMAIGNTKTAREINSYLLSIQTSIYDHYKYLREKHNVVSSLLIINSFLGIKEKKDKGKQIIEIFQEHNDKIKLLSRIDFSEETIQRYETSLMHTQNFIRLNIVLPISRTVLVSTIDIILVD